MNSPTKIVIFFAIAIILVVIVFFYLQNKNNSKLISTNNSTPENNTRNIFNKVLSDLKSNASNNPLTIDTLISALDQNGIQGVKEGTVIDMVYNPKRVVIRETVIACITTPCYNDFSIVSIG